MNEIVQLEESTARRKYIAVSPTAVVTMETWSPLNTLHLQTHLRPKSSNNILLLGQMINETLHEVCTKLSFYIKTCCGQGVSFSRTAGEKRISYAILLRSRFSVSKSGNLSFFSHFIV